jgi:hypothetical protein
VLKAGSSPGPVVRPAGLVFTTARGASPGSQDLTISNLTDHLITFTSADSVVGQPWFSHFPASGAVTPQQPAGVIVQLNTSALQPGVYRGTIILSFSDSSVRTVALLLVVTQDGALPRAEVANDSNYCAPGSLFPVLSSFTSGEVAIAGQSNTIEVQIVDDCANPASADSVWAQFDNSDSALSLVSLGDGTWMGSWIPTLPSGPEPLNLTIRAIRTDPQSAAASRQRSRWFLVLEPQRRYLLVAGWSAQRNPRLSHRSRWADRSASSEQVSRTAVKRPPIFH